MNQNPYAQIEQRLLPSIRSRKPWHSWIDPRYTFLCGLENRKDPKQYHLLGHKRGNPKQPEICFQFTLEGKGIYQNDRSPPQPQTPGHAFLAILPSPHRYYLPEDSPSWKFFWIILHHPYANERIRQTIRTHGNTLSINHPSPLLDCAITLFQSACKQTFSDTGDLELSTIRLAIEIERHVHEANHPERERIKLLNQTRQWLLPRIKDPLKVESMAAQYGLSRSAFSHHYKKITGISPGTTIARIRAEEAAKLLRESRLRLKEIAAQCGYADAVHLGKAFKRHWNTTPAQFRKLHST